MSRKRTDLGRVKRPPCVVLPDDSLVSHNDVADRFTHQVTRHEPFYFTLDRIEGHPDGWFEPGTRVERITQPESGHWSQVRDSAGVCAYVADDSLVPLP